MVDFLRIGRQNYYLINNMEIKNNNILLIALLLVIAILLLVIGWIFNKFFEILNIVLIAGTLYWLLRYTLATEHMKKQMIRQNDFAQRPIINLYYKEAGANRINFPHFAIRNVGNTPAYNISIDDIHLEEYWFAFDLGAGEIQNVILEKEKDEKSLNMMGRTYDRGKLTQGSNAFKLLLSKFNLLDEYTDEKFQQSQKRFSPFIIRYWGLDGRNFHSVFKLYQQHPSVTDRIIKFIKTDEGDITMDEVIKLCQREKKFKSMVEKIFT